MTETLQEIQASLRKDALDEITKLLDAKPPEPTSTPKQPAQATDLTSALLMLPKISAALKTLVELGALSAPADNSFDVSSYATDQPGEMVILGKKPSDYVLPKKPEVAMVQPDILGMLELQEQELIQLIAAFLRKER